MKDFQNFYQQHYPPEIKPLFEAYLVSMDCHGLMPEIQKLGIAAAFLAGYQAGIQAKSGIKS
ncbi:hypothetical protein [Pseudanabaena sp. 'Roaring Creek']|uniref:hypothetical protein n=1 Tax=Pseudanabaena sp. 'Roaring Creek' TaxID=1681830 RepID=UPI0006D816D2|nr:hypothetical protein [Pseudanabaena sp. 'Roaring Creek']